MPTLDWRTPPFAEDKGTRHVPNPPVLHTGSLGQARDIRVTARIAVGAFTTGNLNNTSTAPAPPVDTRPGWAGGKYGLAPVVKPARKPKRKRRESPLKRTPSANLSRGIRRKSDMIVAA